MASNSLSTYAKLHANINEDDFPEEHFLINKAYSSLIAISTINYDRKSATDVITWGNQLYATGYMTSRECKRWDRYRAITGF